MKYVLGIDIGTGSVKAVPSTLGETLLRSASSIIPLVPPNPAIMNRTLNKYGALLALGIKGIIEKTGGAPAGNQLKQRHAQPYRC